MKKIIILLCLLLVSIILSAQTPPEILWSKIYGGSGNDKCQSIQITNDGGYALAGLSNSFGNGFDDAWLVKTNEDGDSLWSKTYGDSYIDEAYVIIQTANNGYILGGVSTAFGWAGEGWLIKTDNLGNTIWQNGYHGDGTTTSDWDNINDVLEIEGTGYLAVGITAAMNKSHQGWAILVDQSGNTIWNKNYGGFYWERLFDIRSSNDGSFIVSGDQHVNYNGHINHDGWIMKINANGDSLWSQTYGDDEIDLFRALYVDDDGSIIACGETKSYGIDDYKAWVVKTDPYGNEIWNNTYGLGAIFTITKDQEDNYVVGGTRWSDNSQYNGLILKINQNGDLIWEDVIYASPQDDMIESIHATYDGGYIFGGRTNATVGTGDFWLVKLAPDFTIDEEYNEEVIAITNFPNPATDDVTFKYTIKNTNLHERVEIKIYNLHGQLVDTIEGNNGIATLRTKNYKNGMYFYSIESGNYSAKNKIIIMK